MASSIVLLGLISKATATTEIGVAILTASLIYISFRKRLIAVANTKTQLQTHYSNLILHIIFFITFAFSLVMAQALYRSPAYFVLTSICAAIIAIGIYLVNRQGQIILLLVEILLVSLSLRACLFYEYPGFYGVDPWAHAAIISTWLSEGHIVSSIPASFFDYTGYVNFPVMHLNVMLMQLVTSLNIKDSLFTSVGLFYVASILFVFLFGKRIGGDKIGLLSSLLISVMQFHITWGAWLIPTSLGVGIFSMILYKTFSSEKRKIEDKLIWIIIILTIVFAHTVSSFVALCTSVIIVVVKAGYDRFSKTYHDQLSLSFGLIILFGVSLLTRWIYSYYYPSLSFFEAVTSPLMNTLRTEVMFVGSGFSPSTFIWNRVGFLLLIGFIVLGSLSFLSNKYINGSIISLILTVSMMAVIIYGLPLFHIKNIIPERWLVFVAVLSAPITAQGVDTISKTVNGKFRKTMLLTIVVFSFSFFMINSTGVNAHSPFYGGEYSQDPVRYSFTQSELTVVDTISKVWDGKIKTDFFYYYLPFMTRLGPERLEILDAGVEEEGMVVLRAYTRTHYTQQNLIENSKKLSLDYFSKFSTPKFDTVYDNSSVTVYMSNP